MGFRAGLPRNDNAICVPMWQTARYWMLDGMRCCTLLWCMCCKNMYWFVYILFIFGTTYSNKTKMELLYITLRRQYWTLSPYLSCNLWKSIVQFGNTLKFNYEKQTIWLAQINLNLLTTGKTRQCENRRVICAGWCSKSMFFTRFFAVYSLVRESTTCWKYTTFNKWSSLLDGQYQLNWMPITDDKIM